MTDEKKDKVLDETCNVSSKEYKCYPERSQTEEPIKTNNNFASTLFGNRSNKYKCEKSVVACAKKYPLVKIMLNALKSSGCPVNFERHISCEYCTGKVNGGYDPYHNQVIICFNRTKKKNMMQAVLAHELLHMYDNCRTKFDFNNLEHIACTEIRAANLFHCSILSGILNGSVSPFNIKEAHKDCIKYKAIESLTAIRDLTNEEAIKIVDKVFDKCYNDLEPLGRRIRRNSKDIERIYRERLIYGYY